jgi:hypothetical protein
MMRLAVCAALGAALLPAPARAEKIEYKGATLIRQEEHGVMVFDTKDGEVKATPSLNMKGVDLDGKVYLSNFAAAEKHEHASMLLKVGNVLDVKINKTTPKTVFIEEVRLVKGEVLPWEGAKSEQKAEKLSYSKAKIKSIEKKTVTFEANGKEITAELAYTFKATDASGQKLRKDERLRVFNEGNEATIATTKKGEKETITDVKLTKGSLTDK